MVQIHSSTLQLNHTNGTVILICLEGTGRLQEMLPWHLLLCVGVNPVVCHQDGGAGELTLQLKAVRAGLVQPGERTAAGAASSSPLAPIRGVQGDAAGLLTLHVGGRQEKMSKSSNRRGWSYKVCSL